MMSPGKTGAFLIWYADARRTFCHCIFIQFFQTDQYSVFCLFRTKTRSGDKTIFVAGEFCSFHLLNLCRYHIRCHRTPPDS